MATFGGGDPINLRDPQGLDPCEERGPHFHGTKDSTTGEWGITEDHTECADEDERRAIAEWLANNSIRSYPAGGTPGWADFATGIADAASLGLGPLARWLARQLGCESCVNPDYDGAYWGGVVVGALPYATIAAIYGAQGAAVFAPGGALNTGFGGWFRIGWSWHGGRIFRAAIGRGRNPIKIDFWW